ncbi:MAG: fused MFS/spermidine synthase [Actinomycetaceae bacterium]|nr:fused MFS/spermidine synthase [Actinomycetaceae bacterium]
MKRHVPKHLPIHPVPTTFARAELVPDPMRPTLVHLLLDGVESSAIDMDDPSHLEFEYMQHIRLLAESNLLSRGLLGARGSTPPTGRTSPIRALHLGAAGCTIARAFSALAPMHQLAVEIDPELARLAREWFDLPRSPVLRIRVGDARQVLDTTQATWDVIVRDAFMDREVPEHLRTLEAAARAHSVLEPGGIYLLNAVATAGLRRIDEDIAALMASFAHVVAITDPAIFSGKRFGNIVLAASDAAFDLQDIRRHVRRLSLPAKLFDGGELGRRGASVRPLSDADAAWPETTP